MPTEILAREAYEAYADEAEWKNYQGLPMPEWQELPTKIKNSWMAAVQRVEFVLGKTA